jgi:importin subunit alpha-2
MAHIRFLAPAAAKMLTAFSDTEIMVDSCWALTYLSDGSNHNIDQVVGTGVVPRVVAIMQSTQESRIITPCVRIIGNIVFGTDEQTDAVIRANVFSALGGLLEFHKMAVFKEVCWLISNIAAGNHSQINAVFESGLIPKVIQVIILGH